MRSRTCRQSPRPHLNLLDRVPGAHHICHPRNDLAAPPVSFVPPTRDLEFSVGEKVDVRVGTHPSPASLDETCSGCGAVPLVFTVGALCRTARMSILTS